MGVELTRILQASTGNLILRIERNAQNNSHAGFCSTDGGATWVGLPGSVQRTLSNRRLGIMIDYDVTGTQPTADLAWVEIVRVPVQPPRALTSATPSSGSRGQTISVVLTGNTFSNAAMCSFSAGITVNSCVFNSTTQLTANITVASSAALGSRNVTVTNPDGQTANLAGGFGVTP